MLPNSSFALDQIAETAVTCRGRAYHARMGAQEAEGQDMRVIFARLAALYEGMAVELERLQRNSRAHGRSG